MVKKLLMAALTIVNMSLNLLQLIFMFVMTSKVADMYGTGAATLYILPVLALIGFLCGCGIWIGRAKPWAQILIALPLIIGLLGNWTPVEGFLKTKAMRDIDERNRRHMACVAEFLRTHPGDPDWMTACPIVRRP